jgi:hypothetical protein
VRGRGDWRERGVRRVLLLHGRGRGDWGGAGLSPISTQCMLRRVGSDLDWKVESGLRWSSFIAKFSTGHTQGFWVFMSWEG